MKAVLRIVLLVLGILLLNACTNPPSPTAGVWDQTNWDGAVWQ